jgi:hypothetical protein
VTPCANAVRPDVGRNEADIDSRRANAHASNADIEHAGERSGRCIEGDYYITAALCRSAAAHVIC